MNYSALAFTIHPSDTLKPNMFEGGAPSRPPSRVSQKGTSQANGNFNCVGYGIVQADQFDIVKNQTTNIESEEEQMSRAVAISMGENPDFPDLSLQETGVLDHQSKNFGPATRSHYEPQEWALTLPGAQTQEILLNPEPNDRRRPRNAPAFLKPSPTGHRLPSLITIIHAIPMAREALLNRGYTLPEYGMNKEWWDGNEIKVLRIVNVDSDRRKTNGDDIIYECQRLMAFLDETDRAYGNADVLARLGGLDRYESDKVARFLDKWQDATSQSTAEAPLAMMFMSIGTKMDTTNPESAQTESFWCLTSRVGIEVAGKGLTLYEVLDDFLWGDNHEDDVTYFEDFGDVVSVEVMNQVTDVPGLGIGIPAVLYLDRYLQSPNQQAKDMRMRKAELNIELQNKEAEQSRMTQAKKSTLDTELDGTQLLAKAAAYFEQIITYRKASTEQSGANGVSPTHDQSLALSAKIAEELKAVTKRVTHKLEGM